MYKVSYNDNTIEISTNTEVISCIQEIIHNKKVENQLVVIDYDQVGSLEIGLGLKDKSVLFFIPVQGNDDIMISCNDTISDAKSELLFIEHAFGEMIECTASNLISLEDALRVLEVFLSNQDIFELVDWYIY